MSGAVSRISKTRCALVAARVTMRLLLASSMIGW
jgi:hypothetical protein